MEKKGLFKLPYSILIYDIPKYMELNDYINYASTCKFLNNNFVKSDLWKRELYKKYTEDEILFAEDKKSSYEKFKKLVTQTISYKKCNIAHRDTYWNEEIDFIKLRNVCWFHIIGKMDNVEDGRYIPEFKVKFTRRPLGLNHLEFIASVIEKEIEQKNEKKQIQKNEKRQIKENDSIQNTEQNNDNENSDTQINTNKVTSLFGVILSTLSFGFFNNTKSIHNINNDNNNNNDNGNNDNNDNGNNDNNDNNDNDDNDNNDNNDNDDNDDNEKEELYSKVILTTQYKFNRNIITQHNKDEWCIVECPEIIINRSSIDPSKSKLIVQLEIKDINGNWKNGLSFKSMHLRTVIPSDIDSEIE